MGNHIIVVLDHSGSMASPFSSDSTSSSVHGLPASHAVKIDEAKAQLVAWLQSSDYDHAIVIPFSNHADTPIEVELPAELPLVKQQLRTIDADGGTNLASALTLAVDIGSRAPDNAFLRYLVITDGLSQTPDEDLVIIEKLPSHQGLDAILIDPTPRGEAHLKKLPRRGRFIPVYGAHGLQEGLDMQDRFYKARASISAQHRAVMSEAHDLLPHLRHFKAMIAEYPDVPRELGNRVEFLHEGLASAVDLAGVLAQKIASPEVEISELIAQIESTEELCRQAKELLPRRPRLDVSLGYPRKLSKGHSSTFVVQIYPPEERSPMKRSLQQIFGDTKIAVGESKTELLPGMEVVLELSSPDIEFASPSRKALGKVRTRVVFWGKPKDSCLPGTHAGLLAVSDAQNKKQYASIPFEMRVVDYAFDHVSRPLLGGFASFSVGAASILTFVLTFLGQVDKTFGFASGTFGGAVAAFVFSRILSNYRAPAITAGQEGPL